MTVFFTTHYMEEAEKNADRIVIIDNGKIVAEGTADQLRTSTQSKTLEDAFLSLTGHAIRNEEVGAVDRLRAHHGGWRH
jgi:ABC-2 type transport system ATP-binding protein